MILDKVRENGSIDQDLLGTTGAPPVGYGAPPVGYGTPPLLVGAPGGSTPEGTSVVLEEDEEHEVEDFWGTTGIGTMAEGLTGTTGGVTAGTPGAAHGAVTVAVIVLVTVLRTRDVTVLGVGLG
jgi:hypothetical protein